MGYVYTPHVAVFVSWSTTWGSPASPGGPLIVENHKENVNDQMRKNMKTMRGLDAATRCVARMATPHPGLWLDLDEIPPDESVNGKSGLEWIMACLWARYSHLAGLAPHYEGTFPPKI